MYRHDVSKEAVSKEAEPHGVDAADSALAANMGFGGAPRASTLPIREYWLFFSSTSNAKDSYSSGETYMFQPSSPNKSISNALSSCKNELWAFVRNRIGGGNTQERTLPATKPLIKRSALWWVETACIARHYRMQQWGGRIPTWVEMPPIAAQSLWLILWSSWNFVASMVAVNTSRW